MYTLQLSMFGVTRELIWDDGVLTGDTEPVRYMLTLAPSSDVTVNGMPSIQGLDILEDGLATFHLAKQLFDDVQIVNGDLPEEEEVPEGAVV